ncbi:hypothetical protein SISNIDRAFT_356158 [Sistotremastrum niveocremeum HHB9708]|uniref:Uncharacterized protein n=2 Tax=Sistotremastraceae TaxID=3402574 RepID=A0A164WIB1_9AGAM|nr:hypothetical protein SISNIDRAFT_356158 [Sistotremastrum niveocremeum HHB9708]KZT34128.1 hypothetical protein SISSUDRAFT_313395 [Sistotremastrum suecicum HHB10207 ss-3]
MLSTLNDSHMINDSSTQLCLNESREYELCQNAAIEPLFALCYLEQLPGGIPPMKLSLLGTLAISLHVQGILGTVGVPRDPERNEVRAPSPTIFRDPTIDSLLLPDPTPTNSCLTQKIPSCVCPDPSDNSFGPCKAGQIGMGCKLCGF